MKRILFATVIAAAAACSFGSAQAAQVGVSVGFAAPGAYGRVDIGRFPAPALVSRTPVMVGARLAVREPLYLWVPYEHRVRWADYCASYGACGRPVYFVDDGWYRQNVYSYAPRPVVYDYGYGGRPYVRNGYWHDGYWRDGDWRDGDWRHDRDDYRDRDDRHDRDGYRDDRHDRDGDDHHDGDDYHDHDGRGAGDWRHGNGRGY